MRESLRTFLIAPEQSRYLATLRKDLPSLECVSEVMSLDLLLLLIHADRGLSQDEIAIFNSLRERQTPAIILVGSLMPASGDLMADDRWDFDDLVMLINRTLEKAITPYLVLHDESGLPIGLYDLINERVIDYSSIEPMTNEGDPELRELVKDFKAELDEEGFEPADFTSGLRVIALPYIPERSIGVRELSNLVTMLQQVRP